MRRRLAFSVLPVLPVLALLACAPPAGVTVESPEPAGSESAPEQSAEPSTEELDRLVAREFGKLPIQTVSAKDGSFKLTVEAKSVTLEQKPELTVLTADLGTDQPLTCFIYGGDSRAGAQLTQWLTAARKVGSPRGTQIDGVDLVGDSAAMRTSTGYLVEKEERKSFGLIKGSFWSNAERSVGCVHDEVGYLKSFERVTRGLLESFTYASQLGRPSSAEIFTAKIGNRLVGFTQSWQWKLADTKLMDVSFDVSVVPVSDTEVRTSDTLVVSSADRDGRVVTLTRGAYQDGAETYTVRLNRAGKADYKYEGTVAGKPVSGSVVSKDGVGLLVSSAREQALLKRLKAGKSGSVRHESWDPGTNPAVFEPNTETLDVAQRTVTLKHGPHTALFQLDKDGYPSTGQVELGKVKLDITRVLRR